jgi:two-component system sensor histidine kinase KdpD
MSGRLRFAALAPWKVLRGTVAIGLLTAVCFAVHANSAITAMLFLVAGVLHSLDAGFLAAVIFSLEATLCLDFFFLPPIFHLNVDDPMDGWTLVALLLTTLVVSSLASKARAEANLARREREFMEQEYALAQRLLVLDPATPVPGLLRPFIETFHLAAACLFEAETAESHVAGVSNEDLSALTRSAYVSGKDQDDPHGRFAVRCLRRGAKLIGSIGFEGLNDPAWLSGPMAVLAAISLERASAYRKAGQASVHAQTEVFRAAILDALAHEFKTPLATIMTAAGGIRAAGPLGPQQEQLAEMVESEASRLSRLTSRMLRTVRLDQEEVKPLMEPFSFEEICAHILRRYQRRFPSRRFVMESRGGSQVAQGDAELLRLALSQLLDNACKYSEQDSEIRVDLELSASNATVFVSNQGSRIPLDEREHVFERFYRGADARLHTPGSGLGLYVARKIAVAHGGYLDLDPIAASGDNVTFRLTIPIKQGGPEVANARL